MNSDNTIVDDLCDQFEREWLAGSEPDPGGLLDEVPDHLRVQLAHQLVLVDTEYRQQRFGTAPSLEDYARQLGLDVQDLIAVADTVVGEDTIDGVGDSVAVAGDVDDQAVAQTFVPQSDAVDQGDFGGETVIGAVDPDFPEDRQSATGGTEFHLQGYEILSELGRGGMGVVYKARQLKPSRLVALKTIHAPAMNSSVHIQRFQAEAEAAGRLDHRGIVPVFEVGEQHGVHFFSMGFVDGRDLEHLARKQVLPCVQAARLIHQVADALEYAHQHGVIHRDIKPHNILIDADGNARITDFGLAKLAESDVDLTGSGQIMGTAAYMPPEQATGRTSEAGPTADVYALGATLYRCITGRPPFQAASAIEIMRQVVDDEPIAPRRLNNEVDEDIQTLCLKCLEKAPERRFQTAGELAAELNRYLNGESILSRPVGPVIRLWRWCRRRPYVAVSSILALCLFLGIAAGIPLFLLQLQRIASTEAGRQQAEELAESNRVLADTEKYYSTVMKVRELRIQEEPPPGWTWSAQEMLQQAGRSAAPNKDLVELRTLMTELLLAPDMRLLAKTELPISISCMAISDDGSSVAVGEYLGVPLSSVNVFELSEEPPEDSELPMSLQMTRQCSINTVADKLRANLFNRGAGAESMNALDFSADGNRLAVATRNAKLIVWNIQPTKPEIEFERRYDWGWPSRIEFSGDEQSLHTIWGREGEPHSFSSSVSLESGEQSDAILMANFHRLQDDQYLICQFDAPVLSNGVVESPTTPLEIRVDYHGRLNVDSTSRVAVHDFAGRATLFEAHTGRSGIAFGTPISQGLGERHFAGGTSLLVDCGNGLIHVWDAISGQLLRPIRFSTRPMIAVDRVHHRIYICQEKDLLAYELRVALTHEPAAGTRSPSPLRIFAPRVRPIDDFDVSDDGTRLALIERDEGGPRVFEVLTSTGDITRQWRFWNMDEQPPVHTATNGGAWVTHLGSDQLVVSGSVPGNILALSDNGLEPVTGLGMDVVTAGIAKNWPTDAAEGSAASQTVVWEATETAHTQSHNSFRVAITLKMPARLKIAQEKIRLRLLNLTGDDPQVLHEIMVDETDVDDVGSYTLFLGTYTRDSLPEKWGVEAQLMNSEDLHFHIDGTTDSAATTAIRPGKLLLFPIVPDAASLVSVRHLSGGVHGHLAAIIGPNVIRHWSGQPLALVGQGWQDFVNMWRDGIQDLSAADDTFFTGSNSGLTAQIQSDGQFQVLRKQIAQAGDDRIRITAVACSADGQHAAAGTIAGELQVYQTELGTDALVARTDAHPLGITAVAISNDGQLLASGDENGSIRLWTNTDKAPQLLFSLPTSKHRCVKLEFSADGRFLYFLREHERGVQRLDLQMLQAEFAASGIAW